MSDPIKTVFRTFHNGDVIALFPEVPSDRWGHHCMSYQHVGQHGGASPDLFYCTRPSTRDEIVPLKSELERVGYTVEERIKVTRHMDEVRRASAIRESQAIA